MSRQFNPRVLFWFVIALLFVSSMLAMAAGNVVPGRRLGEQTSAINANALKPAACSALNLTAIVICPAAGNCNASNANELILGRANADNINGGNGADCILGGGGADSINGGPGNDVCLGGPGTDTFNNCETQVQ